MKPILTLACCAGLLAGCELLQPPGPNKPKPLRGPRGSYGYKVEVLTSEPGSKIEVNQEYIGDSPITITLYGDNDGTFRRPMDYIIRAYPVKPGQNLQWKFYTGGGDHIEEDRIPKRIYFDLNLERAPEKKELKITTEDKTPK